jgi:FMN reductase
MASFLARLPLVLIEHRRRDHPRLVSKKTATQAVPAHADPVPTVVVAGPADGPATAGSDAGRLRACIDRGAAELAAAMRSHRR